MLQRILADTYLQVAERRSARPAAELERVANQAPPPIDFAERLRRPGVQLIAEIKRRSPSKGDLKPELDPASLAVAYAEGGAAAISVLTEPTWFGGQLADLQSARSALDEVRAALPLLRKDFIVDPYQVLEARAYGADAVLLIVAALSPERLALLSAEAARWSLAALVEVHDEAELERALEVGARIVGINSRNLNDMAVDLRVVERLRPRVPQATLVVAESGIHSPEDVRRLHDLGVDAMLVGEELVRSPDPRQRARELVEAGQ